MSSKNLKLSSVCYFFISIVLEGLQRLSGLFVLELLQTTNVSRQTACVPFILSWIASNIIASFSDILIDSKNSENVLLTGVLLSATGAGFCILSTHITTFTIFWGLLFGSGHGLASPHLSKRLMKADCPKLSFVLQMTPCLGVLIIPFAFSVFNSHYGLQGSCLIFCGVLLNYLPLALAAAYNIEISIPNIKWRVRKKSKQYFVSKPDESKTFSNESFINSFEPDPILNMFENGEFQDETMKKKTEHSTNVATGRKRSETRGCFDNEIFPRNKTNSQMFVELKYETFEWNFIAHDEMEHTKSKTTNCNKYSGNKLFQKNILNESEVNFKNSECKTNQTFRDDKKSKTCTDNSTTNATLYNPDIREDAEQEEPQYYNSLQEVHTTKALKDNFQFSSTFGKKLPLDIKVHVEECTFQAGEDDWEEIFNSRYLTARKSNHSNSLVLGIQKSTDFSSQNFPKNFPKCSNTYKPKLPSIYSIPENSELVQNSIIPERKSSTTEANKIFNFLKSMSSRICLCISLIKILFEINLVTLLTIFADFGSDIDAETSDFKWILIAFGVGGLIGKICCCKILKTIPEKCHAIGVVLFLLTGLSTAGILYSSNLSWLASFFCILGALEGGITYLIPKFVLEYVHKDIQSTLFSVKKFLCGVSIICVPYAIGLFRDKMGEYEFLLQVLSCSSVLCAFLAYFLPYLRMTSSKRTKSVFRSKLETA